LSTSESAELAHYAPDEALQVFKVPRNVFEGWKAAGGVEYYNDLYKGILTREVRILAGPSGEMNNYLVR
jgi:hypothetical protein